MNESYTLVLTQEQLLIIDKAVQQIPYYIAAPLLAEINKQIVPQNKKESK